MPEPVTLINVFEVPGDQASTFLAIWEKTRDYLETQPGYIDTALHQALTPTADFRFVNVAHWATAEEFTNAIRSAGFPGERRVPDCVPSARQPLSGRPHLAAILIKAPARVARYSRA